MGVGYSSAHICLCHAFLPTLFLCSSGKVIHMEKSSTNFSNMRPLHRLPFFMTCSSMCPSYGLLSLRSSLFLCESPQGQKSCQETHSSLGLSLHRATAPHRSLFQHRLLTWSQPSLGTATPSGVEFSTGCRQISAPPWTSIS